MNEALNLLSAELASSFTLDPQRSNDWTDRSMTRALAHVESTHSAAAIVADSRSITAAVLAFRQTGSIKERRELKYLCLGASLMVDDWCVLADRRLRGKLSDAVANLPEMRRRTRCFQALLSSYWTFPLNGPQTTREAKEGWAALRTWLRNEFTNISNSREPKPKWFGVLERHKDLLSDQPCGRFGKQLLTGDTSGLADAIEGLAIPKSSWVLEETVFAQTQAAADLPDAPFKEALAKVLAIATGKSDVSVGEPIRIRCVACLVSRYALCADRTEHTGLRDAAITTIGNPWVRREKWDAWVVNAKGKPDDSAREMVNSWLKRRLITDFFVLLSVDGTGDPRRLDYWLRFEPFIDEMWFALGYDARLRKGEHFDEFRTRARGRLLNLEETTGDNNAFVMRIGKYLAIEFGAKGHAFYLFKWDSLNDSLVSKLRSGLARTDVGLRLLKASDPEERLIHRDSAAETWEQKFDGKLCWRLGQPKDRPRTSSSAAPKKPSRGPSATQFYLFTAIHRLRVEDLRSKGGALWVIGTEFTREVSDELAKFGFRPRPPRGWFKE